MSGSFAPKLEVLPAPQQRLWTELGQTPQDFTLYGGTAIALRLGHRSSVDFDFFSSVPFDPAELAARVPYLRQAAQQQVAPNTLTMMVDRDGPVQVSFFGGMRRLGQVEEPDLVDAPTIAIASLLDLAGMKVAVVSRRAEPKDYLDIHALMVFGGLSLPSMLAAAEIIYGSEFSALIALKAISYHEETALRELPRSVRGDLIDAVRVVDVDNLPHLTALRRRED